MDNEDLGREPGSLRPREHDLHRDLAGSLEGVAVTTDGADDLLSSDPLWDAS